MAGDTSAKRSGGARRSRIPGPQCNGTKRANRSRSPIPARLMIARGANGEGACTGLVVGSALIRLDRKRTGKRLSNDEWVSRTDPEARIARMKDGTTHLAYKPEHAVDLDTGAVVAAEVHAADEGDTTTITGTLDAAHRNLTSVGAPPSSDNPTE